MDATRIATSSHHVGTSIDAVSGAGPFTGAGALLGCGGLHFRAVDGLPVACGIRRLQLGTWALGGFC